MSDIMTTTGEYGDAEDPAPTAAHLAEQAAELQKRAVERAEQDVKDAEKAVTDTTQARANAMRARAAARQSLREIKAGSKPKAKDGEKKARQPRGASRTAVAGALSPGADAAPTTN